MRNNRVKGGEEHERDTLWSERNFEEVMSTESVCEGCKK